MLKPKKIEIIFIKKIKESEDTYSFYFNRKNLNFDFLVGQYIKLFLDINSPDARGSSRNFTISSSPTEEEYLIFTTKIIKSSFKKKLMQLKRGDMVKAFGPIGYFDFNEEKNNKIVLIAGGIGVTPYYSLIKYINDKKLKIEVYLFASFEQKENVIFFDELNKIHEKNNSIKIIYTLTQDKNNYAGYENGRINEELIKKYIKEPVKSKYYIVGSPKMVEDLYTIIRNLNIKDENIFREDFTGY